MKCFLKTNRPCLGFLHFATINLQAWCEYFHPVTMLETVLAATLLVGFVVTGKKA